MKALTFLFLFFHVVAYSQPSVPVTDVQGIIEKSIDDENIFGVTICLGTTNNNYTFASGNLKSTDYYFIASVTKLYTTAVIYKMVDLNLISLDDYIASYFSPEVMDRLHVLEGENYSNKITIRHLLSNTSGLSDYFEQQNKGEKSVKEIVVNEKDTLLSFQDIITISKKLPPQFIPGEAGKAFYSDTNFQLLGQIIEKVSQKSLSEVYQEYIFTPLNLKNTFLYALDISTEVTPIYIREKELQIPKMMSSFRADGGIVSTPEENMIFLKSFFSGMLFSKSHLDFENSWNKLEPPFQYGLGVSRFKFPGTYELIGHHGASGSFAFYCPEKEVYITGTVNQVNKPQLPYKMIMKIMSKL